MKENIIQAIVAKMQRNLDSRQMAQLKTVLASELHNVEIIEKADCLSKQSQENEHICCNLSYYHNRYSLLSF